MSLWHPDRLLGYSVQIVYIICKSPTYSRSTHRRVGKYKTFPTNGIHSLCVESLMRGQKHMYKYLNSGANINLGNLLIKKGGTTMANDAQRLAFDIFPNVSIVPD